MKLNDKKFGKIFAEPNPPKSAEPRTELNRNFGRFLYSIKYTVYNSKYAIVQYTVYTIRKDDRPTEHKALCGIIKIYFHVNLLSTLTQSKHNLRKLIKVRLKVLSLSPYVIDGQVI